MADKPTIELLDYKIDQLCEQVKDGFSGVHARQDTANHGIKKNKEWIDINKKSLEDLVGDRKNKIKRYGDIALRVIMTVICIVLGIKLM